MGTQFFLAVDGGGTKTTVWIADQNGEVVGRSTTGPMSLAATNEKKAVENFLSAVKEAGKGLKISDFQSVMIGLAGVDTEEEQSHALQLFSSALKEHYEVQNCKVENDTVIALASGTTSPNAIVLISGTGSNCFGKNSLGKTAKAGGMDFLLSDQGSGFEIGQQVLRAAVKSFDGRSSKSLLEQLVCEHFQIDSVAQLKNKVYHPPLNKTQIGQLGKLCFIAREQADTIANEIVVNSLKEMQEMIVTVLRRLQLADKPTDLVLIGGIATDPYIHSQLELRLKVQYSVLRFVVPQHPPVYGALQIALGHVQL